MKHLYYIAILGGFLFTVNPAFAQEEGQSQQQTQQRRSPRATTGSRVETQESNVPELTVRAQNMNEHLTQDIGNARWMRVIYREVDLTKEQNAPLYYPVRPINKQMNLFTIIFRLLGENKILAYEYLDGYEDFSPSHQVNFKDLLDRFYILYKEETVPGGGGVKYVIDDSDVPSEEVKAYYVKEAWYFDQHNSVFDVKTLAISPILFNAGDMGEQRMPMFWLPYESIRPYVSTVPIMTSNINNAKTFTIDDYFRKRMFAGDIVKTENLMNRNLQQYCPTPDSMSREQARIEKELTMFRESLWVPEDTATVAASTNKESKGRVKSVRGQAPAKQKTVKQKASKPEKSAPTRSVRRTR